MVLVFKSEREKLIEGHSFYQVNELQSWSIKSLVEIVKIWCVPSFGLLFFYVLETITLDCNVGSKLKLICLELIIDHSLLLDY